MRQALLLASLIFNIEFLSYNAFTKKQAVYHMYNTNGQEIQFAEKLDTKTNTLLIEPKNLASSELVFVTIKFFDGSVQNKKVLVYAK